MGRRSICNLLSALLLSVGLGASAAAAERIDWLRFDYPPMYVVSGPHAGDGYMDNILQLLIDHMPEYRHTVRVANLSRILSELRQGTNVCIASLFVNEERERLGWISRGETTLLPPLELVYRAEDAGRFKAFGSPASLDAILRDRSLVLGVSDRMSYGPGVDRAVAAHRDQPNVFLRSGRDVGLGLHEMLIKRRIDYTVNYPWAATFTAGPEQARQLGFLPFSEAGGQPNHHVICTRNPWGRRVIERVDGLLADPQLSRQRREFIARWLPEASRAAFREAFDEHFGLVP